MAKPTEEELKQQSRDMLIRIDQKVMDCLPKIEAHLANINGHLGEHSNRITIMETLQKERNVTKISKKTMTGYISGVIAIIVALWRSFTVG